MLHTLSPQTAAPNGGVNAYGHDDAGKSYIKASYV